MHSRKCLVHKEIQYLYFLVTKEHTVQRFILVFPLSLLYKSSRVIETVGFANKLNDSLCVV